MKFVTLMKMCHWYKNHQFVDILAEYEKIIKLMKIHSNEDLWPWWYSSLQWNEASSLTWKTLPSLATFGRFDEFLVRMVGKISFLKNSSA